MTAAVSHGPSALWYATRGAGATTLVLLTISVVLGICEVRRWQPGGVPRFAIAAMHRTISLLALALLAVHIVTTLLDPFPPIGVLNAAVPFVTDYRPLWTGLGTLASDMLVALAVTSLARRRLGYDAWRRLHWLAYACWPVALLHGLGNGSDADSTWMLALTMACVGAVVVAVGGRLAARPARPARGPVAGVLTLALVALVVWMAQGPLASGWARRAGTPAAVLAAFAPKAAPSPVRPAAVDALAKPFTARVSGTIRSGVSSGGVNVVDLSMRLTGGPRGVLRIRLGGQPLAGGGLHMERSAVAFGPPGDPARYRGRIDFLHGTQLRALVGSAGGRAVQLSLDLSLGRDRVGGQLRAVPVRNPGS
jgi:DMSO/TMAO reductase YedYZ heme-binding membrane subunit